MLVEHLFCCCQAGAERALKAEVDARAKGLRLAFSRPGFVTFKLPEPQPFGRLPIPRLVFARASGASLGKVSGGDRLSDLATKVWANPQVAELTRDSAPLRLHVWQRDGDRPGENGFEPGVTALSREAFDAVASAAPPGALSTDDSQKSGRQSGLALDVIMVEPTEWWVGAHAIATRSDRWPGGVPPLSLPEHAVSRAYLKMREALAWSRTPAVKGDVWIELGCAPGGASQALLDAGMRVLGVDPAEVDPAVVASDHFRWLQMRSADVKKREFASARWLAADINAAPNYTLDAVESVVTSTGSAIRGLLLTLKLPEWSLAGPTLLDEYIARVRSWGYRDIRLRQLAFNRREVCLAALRSRGQRRMRRGRTRRGGWRGSSPGDASRGQDPPRDDAAPCRRPPE